MKTLTPTLAFILGALMTSALGMTAQHGANASRGSITTHVGHALRWHYSISTDTVLGVAPASTILPKHCGTSRTFARLWDINTATNDSLAVNGDSVTVTVAAPCSDPLAAPLSVLKTMHTACESTLVQRGYRADTGFWQSPGALPSPACDDWKGRIQAQLDAAKAAPTKPKPPS